MEEFRKLNWRWKTCWSTPSSLYDKKFSDDEKDVFLCHVNEIDHIHLLDSYGRNNTRTEHSFVRRDPRTGQEITKEFVDHSTPSRTLLFANFPRRSSMNSSQHQSCLNEIENRSFDASNASMSVRNDSRTYAQLSFERNKEKAEFLEFVKGEFYKTNVKNCYYLQPQLNRFVTKRWRQSIENVLTAKSKHFQLQSAIPISQSSNDDFTIEYEKTIKETGSVLAVNREKYKNRIQLSCSFLEYIFSNDADITVPLDEQFLLSHPTDVVQLSLTTLASILTSAKDLSTDWCITFTLKHCENQKVIILDEILPASSLSCLERNRLAYKYAVTASIVFPKKKEVYSFEENRYIERTQLSAADKCFPLNPLHESVSNYKVCNFEEYLNKFTDSTTTNNSTVDFNHIRRLWNVNRNTVDYCRLVIDNRQDYCERQKDDSVKFINLSPKMEYQCEFGAEQMSLSELISEWCGLRFGPNTITHRVRIDARSGCSLGMKEVTISDVEHDLRRLYQVKTECLLAPLFNFIEIIKQFPPNEYMLRHLGRHNAQAMVYVKSDETSSTNTTQIADIYKSHQVDTSNIETVPWTPIDDAVCTEIHRRSGVMPCAFPHWFVNGKKKAMQSNDRLSLVEKAVRKDQETVAKKMGLIRKARALKKKRAKLKKRPSAKRAKLNFEGESLDPNELFDEQGNINLFGAASHHQNDEIHQPKDEENSASEIVSFEAYCRDAAVISDDSVILK